MASPISVQCSSCITTLREIVSTLATSDRSNIRVRHDQVNNELDRFSLWVGNIGALHQPGSPLSLEMRLREANDVLAHIRGLLEDITEVADQLLEIVSGEREGMVASLEDKEGDSDDEQVSGAQDDEVNEESELLQEIGAGITRLFRVSTLIRQAAPADLFAKALTRNRYRFNSQFDIAHVGEKYPKLASDEYAWLRKRLGRAIAQRRHYLAYIRSHREKLENMLETNETPAVRMAEPPVSLATPQLRNAQSRVDLASRPSTFLTKATSLAPGRITPQMLAAEEDLDSEDDIKSYTTVSRSVDGDLDSSNIGRIPKLDELRVANKEEVECPFCFRTRKFKNERLWRRHVFSDLRSYVCTFPDCDAPYFSDINEWFNHETQNHRISYMCILCNDQSFTLKQKYLSHMERHHPEMMKAGDEEAVLAIGRRPQRQIPATDCPCCSHEWIDRLKERTFSDETSDSILTVSPQVFKRHLASHLEQLALFAIPIGSGIHGEIDSNAAIEEKTGSGTDETNISALTFHNSKSPSDTTDQVHRSIVEGSIDRDDEWCDAVVIKSRSTAVQVQATKTMKKTKYYYLLCDLDVIMDIEEHHKVQIKAMGDSWQLHDQDEIRLLIEGKHEAAQAALLELSYQESLHKSVFPEAPEYETIALSGQGIFASAFLQWTHLRIFERKYRVRIQPWPRVDYIVSGRKERVHVVEEVILPLWKGFLHRDTLAEAAHHLTLDYDSVSERSPTVNSTAESMKQTLSDTPLGASTESSQNQTVTLHFPQEIFGAIQNTFLAKVPDVEWKFKVKIEFPPPTDSTEAHVVQEAYIMYGVHSARIQARDELISLFEFIHIGESSRALTDDKQPAFIDEEKRKIPLRLSPDFIACLVGEKLAGIGQVLGLDPGFQKRHESVQNTFRTTLQIYDKLWELNKFVKKDDDYEWRCLIPQCRMSFGGQDLWHKHVQEDHAQWFENLSRRLDSESVNYIQGHIDCPVFSFNMVYSRYTQLLKQISDYVNSRAEHHDSPCSPTDAVPMFHPFVVRATRSFYSRFVPGDLEFSPGELVIVIARADQHVNNPDIRKLSQWYYGRFFDRSGSPETITGIFPRNFVEWQKDLIVDSDSEVIKPPEITMELQNQTLKKQHTETKHVTVAEEDSDPPNSLDIKFSSEQDREPAETEGSDIDQLADGMPLTELPGRFSDNAKPFIARLTRYYMGAKKGTMGLIKAETPKYFRIQFRAGDLQEKVPKLYLQWDEDRCAIWRMRTNNGKKEEDLTAMPPASERAAYVTPEAQTDSSMEPNLRKRAFATVQLEQDSSITPELPDFAPLFLRSSREDIAGKFVQLELEQRRRFLETMGNSDVTQHSKWSYTISDDTEKRNRYVNVHPFNYNRIHLEATHGENDYINASHIVIKQTDGEERQYVVTQGPKDGEDETISHFWRMILLPSRSDLGDTSSLRRIVMLTDFEESGRSKCGKYFPLNPDEHVKFDFGKNFPESDVFFGSVRLDSNYRPKALYESFAGETLHVLKFRRLTVAYSTNMETKQELNGKSQKLIPKKVEPIPEKFEHIQLLNWKDLGVPESDSRTALIDMIRILRPQIRKHASNNQPSTIIHCSSGTGRTGVYIALDWLLQELDNGTYDSFTSGEDPVYEIVSELRKQRMMMVNTEAQYTFLYNVLRKEWLEKYWS